MATRRMRDVTIVIYHDTARGTSRNTLAIIRRSDEEPRVIEYLQDPPSRERRVHAFINEDGEIISTPRPQSRS